MHVLRVNMSLLRWLSSSRLPAPPCLPNPEEEGTKASSSETRAVNAVVEAVYDSATNRKRKRGSYNYYEAPLRAKIAKHACMHGNKAAAMAFSRQTGKCIPESTVRGIKKRYLTELKKVQDPGLIEELQHRNRGHPLLLEEYLDRRVQIYIKKLRLAGGVVNRSIVLAVAHGIVNHHEPSLLAVNGGSLILSRKWAESLMKRMGLVRRKGTKAARKLPKDFEEVKVRFLDQVSHAITTHSIPSDLVINWDQTGTKFVPVSQWTMEV